jgi:hypothetical protein
MIISLEDKYIKMKNPYQRLIDEWQKSKVAELISW